MQVAGCDCTTLEYDSIDVAGDFSCSGPTDITVNEIVCAYSGSFSKGNDKCTVDFTLAADMDINLRRSLIVGAVDDAARGASTVGDDIVKAGQTAVDVVMNAADYLSGNHAAAGLPGRCLMVVATTAAFVALLLAAF